jgi:hypothetical protein
MRRLAAVPVLVLSAAIWPASGALAHGSTARQAPAPTSLRADFNNDGSEDLAVGVPFESVGSIESAGAVNVLYGSAAGLSGAGSQLFSQETAGVPGAAEAFDQFGAALAAGDFNGDGFTDLAVGAPGESVGAIEFAGAVTVLYGSAGGLSGANSQLFTQNTAGVGSVAELFDLFGSALAVGDFDNDGFADLAVGAPTESVGAIEGAGAVNVLYGSAGGLSGAGSQLFTQDTPGVPGGAEEFDFFGSALAAGDFDNDGFADLAVGAFGEGVGSIEGAGAVNVLYGSAAGLSGAGSQLFSQDTAGVPGAAEPFDEFGAALAAGDLNGDGFTDLAVGAPSEDVGAIELAGAVNVLYGSAAGLSGAGSQLFSQDTAGVAGTAEPFDEFGSALAAGDFDNDGFADLAAGAPGESLASIDAAGAVNVLYGSAGGLSGAGSQLFSQDTAGVAGTAEPFDQFGSALAAGDFDNDGFADLAAGAPFEGVGSIDAAGAVNVLYGSAGGLSGAGSQLFTQDTPGVPGAAEEFDLFGFTLAVSGLQGATASPTSLTGSASGARGRD